MLICHVIDPDSTNLFFLFQLALPWSHYNALPRSGFSVAKRNYPVHMDYNVAQRHAHTHNLLVPGHDYNGYINRLKNVAAIMCSIAVLYAALDQ